MKISTRGRYGIRAMEVLADNYGSDPISIRTIAEAKHISVPYLEQLFTKMRRAGLVISVRGAHGGYTLSRSPDKITIGEVLRVLEGEPNFVCCNDGVPTCHEKKPCRTHDVLKQIENEIDLITYDIKLSEI